MRIKQKPGDFRVEEMIDVEPRGKGPFSLYRLRKERRNTLEAVAAVAERFGVGRGDVAYLGLKDYDSCATQYFTVPAGPRRGFKLRGMIVEFMGFCDEALSKRNFTGNRFDLTARDLSAREAEGLAVGMRLVAGGGMPNYFDDQRFGSARHGRDFPFRKMLDGQHEEALKLMFATPALQDTWARRARGGKIRKAWGRWGACLRAAESPDETAVFKYLASRSGDFRGALERVDRAYLLLVAYSYQSFLFNEILSRIVAGVSGKDVRKTSYLCGYMAFPTAAGIGGLESLSGVELPLPGAGVRAIRPDVGKVLESVLHNEKITTEALGRPGVKSVQLRLEGREAVVVPGDVRVRGPEADRLNRGRSCLVISMFLPRNSYATIAIKSAEAAAPG